MVPDLARVATSNSTGLARLGRRFQERIYTLGMGPGPGNENAANRLLSQFIQAGDSVRTRGSWRPPVSLWGVTFQPPRRQGAVLYMGNFRSDIDHGGGGDRGIRRPELPTSLTVAGEPGARLIEPIAGVNANDKMVQIVTDPEQPGSTKTYWISEAN